MLKELFVNCINEPWQTIGLDTQYKILNNTLYLQPSSSLSDWINNFDFPAKAYNGSNIKWYVHRGFLRVYKAAREQLLKVIIDNKINTIVGYSHGAAIATLLHEDCIFNGLNVFTYVFGSPRIVWMPGKKILNRWDNFFRINNNGDLVSHLPPFLFGFKHVGTKINIGSKVFIPKIKYHEQSKYIDNLQGL